MSEPHLDEAVLGSLLSIMEGDYPLLVETFLSDSDDRLRTLRVSFQAADWAALRQTSHSFKGSCGSMGALRLGRFSRELEEAAVSADKLSALTLISQMEQEFALVRSLLLSARSP